MTQSVAALYRERLTASPQSIALQFKEDKHYRSWSWQELAAVVDEVAFGLAAVGLEPGQSAAIMANTSHLWALADLAILNNGAVSVPIYPTASVKDVQHILQNSESKVLFVQNEKLLASVLRSHSLPETLHHVVLLQTPRKGKTVDEVVSELNAPAGLVLGFEQLRAKGAELRNQQPQLIEQRVAAIKPEDLTTIIYTSGTTGTPKGVMLLNSTILSLVAELPAVLPITQYDTYLSFLPLSHVFERVCGEFYWLVSGCRYTFAEGLEHLAKNMQEVEPTVMLVVPRLLDKIHDKVMSGVAGASPRAQQLIHWALAVGKEAAYLRGEGKKPRPGLQAKLWLAETLVFRKLRERIGRRLRMIVSGGAPGTPEVMSFFNAIGINVLEGYGLTETAAPTNVNRLDRNKIGTVGPVLPNVQLRLAEDGEILFKGPTIFPGYFKNAEQTAEVFSDGWFHTGDIGSLDADGYLRITDRKKDLIVNSSGKNIAPQKIETMLRTVPFVNQATVFGDKHKTLVALLTLDEQAVVEFARDKGWNFNEYADLIHSNELKRYLMGEIDSRSRQLADYERVRNFAILAHELSVEGGELTATMKVKRNVMKAKYKDLVESLYREDGVLVGSR